MWRARVSPIAGIAKEEIVGSLNVVERAQGARTWIGYPFDSTSSSPTRVNGINRLRLEAEIFSVINRLDITIIHRMSLLLLFKLLNVRMHV